MKLQNVICCFAALLFAIAITSHHFGFILVSGMFLAMWLMLAFYWRAR